ncbi:hypothetical protein BDY19DRAFT_991228 [Irpex rosettiformis]|uniref:Uncharacterized protein n=1 Tax=Irpex rosettiformis TaxID=378272 RepID=A0ACB8UB39_9APHY|nr:hypothetical protein BDY19DRAFT_991228 [Irpex rosettiformis]
MSMKRKLSIEFDDEVDYSSAKRPNLFQFPSADTDVAMSDASSEPELLTPLDFPDCTSQFHSRLNSTASTASSLSYNSSLQNSPSSPPCYPEFILYPSVDQSAANYSPKPVGLMQPKSFTHHGQNCSQIPKLRMACASGINGQRTMWAHCEQCGAIEMVDTD